MGTLKYDVDNIKFENKIPVEFIILVGRSRFYICKVYIVACNCKRLSFVLVAYILYHLNFAEGL